MQALHGAASTGAPARAQSFNLLMPGLGVRREGNKTPKKDPGFVVFVLKPLPHKRFSRRGADLVHKITLPLYQALVGTSVNVETLDKRWVGEVCEVHELDEAAWQRRA